MACVSNRKLYKSHLLRERMRLNIIHCVHRSAAFNLTSIHDNNYVQIFGKY